MFNPSVTYPKDFGTDYRAFWPQACTHCHGDLQLCKDDLGHFRKCANCSRTAPEGLGPNAVELMPALATAA